MMSVGVGIVTAFVTLPDQFCPGTICAVKLIGPFDTEVETSIPIPTFWLAASCWPPAWYWSTIPLASLEVIGAKAVPNVFSGERFSGAVTVRVNVIGSQLSSPGGKP